MEIHTDNRQQHRLKSMKTQYVVGLLDYDKNHNHDYFGQYEHMSGPYDQNFI